jgi:site-specific DNA recombinase
MSMSSVTQRRKKDGLRILGYGRVSQVNGRSGDSFIAPQTYREAIKQYVDRRGHVLLEEPEIELDESGGTLDRPRFQELLRRLEDGEADGLCVPNLARFSRSTIEGLTLARELQAAGKALLIADLDMDTTTPTGKAMMTMLLAFAEMELDQRRENWAIAQRTSMLRGSYPGSYSLGYMKSPDGRLVIDPVAGPVIRSVFERRASGESWAQLARYLDRHLPKNGHTWRSGTVQALLDSPLYLGRLERTVGGEQMVIEEAHEPLVSRSVYEAANRRTSKYPRPSRREHPALLAGIACCASCGGPLTRGSETRRSRSSGEIQRWDYYICSHKCPEPVRISAKLLDAFVKGEVIERLQNSPQVGASLQNGSQVKAHEAALEAAERELGSYVEAVSVESIGREAFAAGAEARKQALELARQELAHAAARERQQGPSHVDLLAGITTLDDGQLNVALKELVASVTVSRSGKPGVTGDLSRRLLIRWTDEAPAQGTRRRSNDLGRKRPPVAA